MNELWVYNARHVCLTLGCSPDLQCRTCCGWCPTNAEAGNTQIDNEPEEIPYARVFEMEKKKRDKMKATAGQ